MAGTGLPAMIGFTRSGLAAHMADGYCRVLYAGDSTMTPEAGDFTDGSNNPLSKVWAIRFRPEEMVAHTFYQQGTLGNQYVGGGANISDNTVRRGNGSDNSNPHTTDGTFRNGRRQFAMSELRDRYVVTAATGQRGGYALNQSYGAAGFDDSWMDRVAVDASVLVYRETAGAAGHPAFTIRAGRRTDGGAPSFGGSIFADVDLGGADDELALHSGELGLPGTATARWPYLNILLNAAGVVDSSVVIALARIVKQGVIGSGFEYSFHGAAGYRPESFLDPADATRDDLSAVDDDDANIADKHLAMNLEARGWPTVVHIQIGLNANSMAVDDAANLRICMEKHVERIAGAYTAEGRDLPWFILHTPYACPSLSVDQHDAYASVFASIMQGTLGHEAPAGSPLTYAPVAREHLAMLNSRQIMLDAGANGTVWDANGVMIASGSGGTGLNDAVHANWTGQREMVDAFIARVRSPEFDFTTRASRTGGRLRPRAHG